MRLSILELLPESLQTLCNFHFYINMFYRNTLLIAFIFIGFKSCTTQRRSQKINQISRLTLLNEYIIPYSFLFDSTHVGGLSGIDYNVKKNEYYFICDERSEKYLPRFYTTTINIVDKKIDSIIFTGVTFLKSKMGINFPKVQKDITPLPDPEALRFYPPNQSFIWASEGERIVNSTKKVLLNPSICEVSESGKYIDTFEIPPQLHMAAVEKGPRQNGVFEGLDFTTDMKYLFVSVEEPLYNDGSRASTNDTTGITRIIKFDIKSRMPVAQYAYLLEPVAFDPVPKNAFKVNGISDILYLGNDRLLIIERSFSVGKMNCTIKIYEADLSEADNINQLESIENKSTIKMIHKKLLLDMDQLGIYIDNIEGVTFGPVLSNGKRSLLFVSDNNFDPKARTQILLFQIN